MSDATQKIKYIVNEQNERVAVQIDIDTYEAIRQFIEDQNLLEEIMKNKDNDYLSLNEAKAHLKLEDSDA